MNRNRKYIVTMTAALGMALAAAAPAMAQDATPVPATVVPTAVPAAMTASTEFFVTSNYLVNIRSGPARSFSILGQARLGDALDVTGRLDDSTWVRVNFNGQDGWVSANLFDVTGDLSTATVVEAPAATGSVATAEGTAEPMVFEPGTLLGSTRVNVNLRSGPTSKSDVLVVIPFSTDLVVTGRNETKNWIRVTYMEMTGWISSGTYFVAQGNIDDVPVVDEAGNVVMAQATAEATAAQ